MFAEKMRNKIRLYAIRLVDASCKFFRLPLYCSAALNNGEKKQPRHLRCNMLQPVILCRKQIPHSMRIEHCDTNANMSTAQNGTPMEKQRKQSGNIITIQWIGLCRVVFFRQSISAFFPRTFVKSRQSVQICAK